MNIVHVSRRRTWVVVRDTVVIVLVAVLVSLLVKTFLVRTFWIPSASMENTLQIGDRVLVDELTPTFTGYHRGDVVVFKDPGGWLPPTTPQHATPGLVAAGDWMLSLVGLSASDSDGYLVKRVIGLPGDHVVCCDQRGQITINDTPINETPYLKLAPGQSAPIPKPFDVTVPPGSLWVLGDNRDDSADSRYHQQNPGHGFVPISNAAGRAVLTSFPLNRFGTIDTHPNIYAHVHGTAR